MDSPERSVAMEFPANDGVLSCSPPTVPTWLKKRLSEPKTPSPSTVEEIEAKLRGAYLRRQKFYDHLSKKARPKPRNPSRSSSNDDDSAQRLEAKLLAAQEKRLRILANTQMRLAKLHELRMAAKTNRELHLRQRRAELGSKMERRVQQAEANRLRILRAYRQQRAALNERTSQSLMRRMSRDSRHKERVRAAIHQKRANAEKKRLGLLEEEKRRARARFLKVQKVANSVSNEQETKRREMKIRLEDRLQRARRKRAEYLERRVELNNVAYDSWGWDILHDRADILSRKLFSCWRKFKYLKKTTAYLANAYNDLNINENSVKSLPFEQLAILIQSASTLHTTKAFLDRLEVRYRISRDARHTTTPSGSDDIDHLLKRVASPKKNSPRKAAHRSDKKSPRSMQAVRSSLLLSRYQVRIVLCAFMILGHPDAVISGQGEREAALVKSAEKFVKELDLLVKVLVQGPQKISNDLSGQQSVAIRTFRSQLAIFDLAWCSFLNSFVVWKTKDAKSLEEDLVMAACRLELSMLQTCKMTSEEDRGPLSDDMKAIQKQVLEDQKLLREKVLHLNGDAGIERMENALSDTRTKFFIAARENGYPVTPLPVMFSPNLVTSDKASEPVGSQKQSSVVRSLFNDDLSKDASSSTSTKKLPQSSRETLDMENVRFVNEYVHGEQLHFEDAQVPKSSQQNDITAKIKETLEKAFWDDIMNSVRQDEPDYSRVVELVREVRDGICAMSPLSWRQEITDTIDMEILSKVLNSGKLDIDYLGKILEYALYNLRKLSAPAYEDELKKKHQTFMRDLAEKAHSSSQRAQVIALIEGLRFLLEQIQDLKREVSKARIRLLEPYLKGPAAFDFLRKAFLDRYGHPSDARSSLPISAQWLSSAQTGKAEEWNEHQILLSGLMTRSNNSTFLPSTVLRSGGGSFSKLSGNQADPSSLFVATSSIEAIDPHSQCKGERIDLLVRLGLLKSVCKIVGLTEGELPETMKLNHFRLRRVQSEHQKIVVEATSLLVLRQTLLSQHIAGSQAHLDSIIANSFKRLSECLDTFEDAGIKEIIESLVSSIDVEDISRLEPIKEIMARMLNKSLQEEDAVFARVSRAVYLALRGAVLGGTGQQGRALAETSLQKVGAALLVDRVMEIGSVLAVAAKVSGIVHGPWYENLI